MWNLIIRNIFNTLLQIASISKWILQKSLGYNCVTFGNIAIFHNLGFHPQPYANLSLLDGDTTSLMNPSRILWKYVQSQRHLLEGLDSQGCHKLVCGYGDVLGYKSQVQKNLEEKKKFLFLEAI
jgi:hypothetical protein